MTRTLACLVAVTTLFCPADGVAARVDDDSKPSPASNYEITIPGPGVLLHSSTSSAQLFRRESAGPDTFDLYGGARRILRDPDGVPNSGDEYVEGKFEDETGNIPRGLSPSPGDWTGVDLTDRGEHWNVSTFNAANLGDHGAGNKAMWVGLDAGDPGVVGWAAAPGYGNDWSDVLIYESAPLADPSIGQTVALDFLYNLDTEDDYDLMTVAYDSAGYWIEVFSTSGTSRDPGTGDFEAPGLRYSEQPGVRTIQYHPDGYSFDDRIRIQISFWSDGAYSDEDGEIDTDGAIQLDDLTITTSQGTFTEDFEGTAPYLVASRPQPIAGDFADVFSRVEDLDPCGNNRSPQLGFIDYGQEPPNGPGVSGLASTGGSTSSTWDYGTRGGYVVNYTGGLDGIDLSNEVWSPAFDWDLPGTEDDDAGFVGAEFAFTVYRHNPLLNGIFWVWHVRAMVDGEWGTWLDRGFIHYGSTPSFLRQVEPVTDLLPPNPEKIQLALGILDLAIDFGYPGDDSTPAPLFDDVRFRKYDVGGVPLTTRVIDLANDAFPVSGATDVSTQAARDALDVRFDMARDVNYAWSAGNGYVPGDSVTVDAAPVIPGTTLADLRMKWALRLNPFFEEAIRALPSRLVDENVATAVDGHGSTIWTGDVVAQPAVDSFGNLTADRYYFDLPDEDFLYPGDQLHYYYESTDDAGRTVTLPADLRGFGEWDALGTSPFSRLYVVRALPTITDVDGSQTPILVYNDFGRRGHEGELLHALGQQGMHEGRDYDTYTVMGPTSAVSNGIGTPGRPTSTGERRGHGATPQQLAGYHTIVYLSGDLTTVTLSDGSNDGLNDKGLDIQTLKAWKELEGQRTTIYFGDSIVSSLIANAYTAGSQYVTDVMGVELVESSVRSSIGGQIAPTVRPTGLIPTFETEFVAFGGCLGQGEETSPVYYGGTGGINSFDHLEAAAGAQVGHGFVDPATGSLYPDIGASIVYDRMVGVDRKIDITFPVGVGFVYEVLDKRVSPFAGSRSRLVAEALAYANGAFVGGPATDVPSPVQPSLDVYPSPFNPKTTVHFVLPRAGVDAQVRVYNLRGERVRTVYDGTAATSVLRLEWDGTDDAGARVGSGIYLVRAVTVDFEGTRKVVLVK